jgi:hypothetical protein
MKKRVKQTFYFLFRLYVTVLLTSVFFVGLLQVHSLSSLLLSLIILPSVFYLLAFIKKAPILNKIKIIFSPLVISLLAVYSLLSSLLVSIINLLNLHSIDDVLISLPLIPVPVFFFIEFLKLLNKNLKNKRDLVPSSVASHTSKEDSAPITEEGEVREQTRRQFIKIIAGTGLGVSLLYLLGSKSASAAFFGSLPGSTNNISIKDSQGNKIDPAIKSPTDGYGISKIDDSNFPHYYGFINKDGGWYILKEYADGSFLYAKGTSNFANGWDNRGTDAPIGPVFGYFNTIFGS